MLPVRVAQGYMAGRLGSSFSGLPARQDVERRAVSGSHQGPPGESQLDPAMPPKATAYPRTRAAGRMLVIATCGCAYGSPSESHGDTAPPVVLCITWAENAYFSGVYPP